MSVKISQDYVKQLTNLGFSKSKSEKALKNYKNNLSQAKTYLQRCKQEDEMKAQKEAELKEKLKQEDERKRKQDEEKKIMEAQRKYEDDLAKAIKASMQEIQQHLHHHDPNYNGNHDDENEMIGMIPSNDSKANPDDNIAMHPCISQYGKCRYGLQCAWRDYPADTCINNLQGTCIFGDHCRNRHRWKGVNLRDGLRGDGYCYDDDCDEDDCSGDSDAAAPAPELHRFNAEATSKPSYSRPAVPGGTVMSGDSERTDQSIAAAQQPTPFLDRLRAVAESTSSSGSAAALFAPNVVVQSETPQQQQQQQQQQKQQQHQWQLGRAGGPAANQKRVPRHPCVCQRGSCKFGTTCTHADLPGDICVHWLNSRCLFDRDSCRYKHHFEDVIEADREKHEKQQQQQQQQEHASNHQVSSAPSTLFPTSLNMAVSNIDSSSSLSTSEVNDIIQRQLMDILGVDHQQQRQRQQQQQPEQVGASFGGFNVSTTPHASTTNSHQHRHDRVINSFWASNNNNGNNSSGDIRLPTQHNFPHLYSRQLEVETREQFAFASLRSAFPHVDPSAILLALRRSRGDVKQAGSCVLDFAEGAAEYVAEYYEHHLPEFRPSSSPATTAPVSPSVLKSDEEKTIALVLLCQLCHSFEPQALQEILEANKWNFEEAFAEAHASKDVLRYNNNIKNYNSGHHTLDAKNSDNNSSRIRHAHHHHSHKITSSAARALREQLSTDEKMKMKSVWFNNTGTYTQKSTARGSGASSSSSSSTSLTEQSFPQPFSSSLTSALLSPSNKLRLEKLAAMFTELDTAVVECAFRSNKFDIDETRQLLLAMAEDCKKQSVHDRLRHREKQSNALLVVVVAGGDGSNNDFVVSTAPPPSCDRQTRQSRLVRDAVEAFYESDNKKIPSSSSSSGSDEDFSEVDPVNALYRKTKRQLDENQESFDWRRARQEAYLTNVARQRTASCAVTAFSRGDSEVGASLMKESKKLAARYARLNMLCMVSLEREQDKSANGLAALDLHGFHLSEALAVLGRRLQLCRAKGIPRLRVIAGTGSHSKDGRAVVLPAALKFVEELGTREKWCWPVSASTRGGVEQSGQFDIVLKRDNL